MAKPKINSLFPSPTVEMFGIPIVLHWSMVLILLLVLFGFDSFWEGISVYGLLFGIVLLHELGHAWAAHLVGCKTSSITLFPLGGIAMMSQESTIDTPGKEFIVIAGGPLVNLVLFILSAIVFVAVSIGGFALEENKIFVYFSIFNLIILVFNMLPIYPLDGGQLLHSIIWAFTQKESKAYYYAGLSGILTSLVVFIFMIFIGNLIGVILISLGLFFSCNIYRMGKSILIIEDAIGEENIISSEKDDADFKTTLDFNGFEVHLSGDTQEELDAICEKVTRAMGN